MGIYFHEDEQLFHLQTNHMSYCIRLYDGYPLHVYWGKRLRDHSGLITLASERINGIHLDSLPQEYPQYGSGDFRNPAYQLQLEDGSRITELIFKGYHIYQGKRPLEGLPAVYVEQDEEATTLEIELVDKYTNLVVTLSYSVFEKWDALTRSVRFHHQGVSSLKLVSAQSASVDFQDSNFEALYLSGAWSREAQIERRPLGSGGTTIESRSGKSSHQLNPFMALVRPETSETEGEVFAFSLVYSGNFKIEAEVDQFFNTRVTAGINPFDFQWQLEPDQIFQTPEVVMVYSDKGLGQMSRNFHQLYRTRLSRGQYRDEPRPILVNNWEGTYFNFNAEKLEAIAKVGAELGIELFVLDDGWFGHRDDDTTSLGDWIEDRRKLPHGLEDLAERINRLGMKFGLWVEPEMVSPDSDLYRAHPDWCIHVEGRRRTLARTQLVLDLSRQEVREYIIESLSRIFDRVPVAYIKWDMNRSLTEIGSASLQPEQQGEVAHRYVLGLYEIYERLMEAYPHILIESCSSGGGRFDPGMLHYSPQIWTSDNTDAVDRERIQYGLSLVYPISAIGAHVSAVPNHQVGRITPLKMRGHMAMSGNFGYELDLTQFTDDEKAIVKEQVSLYKEVRSLVQKGDMYRLINPFSGTGNETAWMFVSKNQTEALVFYFKNHAEAHRLKKTLRLQGLNPDGLYRIEGISTPLYGDQLMYAGVPLDIPNGDYQSVLFRLTSAKK